MRKRVAVALSGGIDSAVTTLLLLQQGYEVVGLTAKMTCDIEFDRIVDRAQDVANKLGIKYYVYDATVKFEEKVIKYFENSYSKGETPNPCIMCNKYIKWGELFDYAINELNVDYIATGHYANILEDNGIYRLYPAIDEQKDQLYFLFCLEQRHLAKTLFPLSQLIKDEVRKIAQENDLPPKSAKESQDICFIKKPNTTKRYLNNIFKSQRGNFVEKSTGKILGQHDGFWQYTIGQRKGIGLAAPEALYVTGINAKSNTVYVGYKNDLLCSEFILDKLYFSYPYNETNFRADVKIRYNMEPVPASVANTDSGWVIKFDNPISSLTKGQACVLYSIEDGHLLGGGWV